MSACSLHDPIRVYTRSWRDGFRKVIWLRCLTCEMRVREDEAKNGGY